MLGRRRLFTLLVYGGDNYLPSLNDNYEMELTMGRHESRIPLGNGKRKLDIPLPQTSQCHLSQLLKALLALPPVAITGHTHPLDTMLLPRPTHLQHLIPLTPNHGLEPLGGQIPQDMRHRHLGQPAFLRIPRPVKLHLADELIVLGEEQHNGDVRRDGSQCLEELLL